MEKKLLKDKYLYTKEALQYIDNITEKFLNVYKRLPEVDLFYGEETIHLGKTTKITKINRYIVAYFDEKKGRGASDLKLIQNLDNIIVEDVRK